MNLLRVSYISLHPFFEADFIVTFKILPVTLFHFPSTDSVILSFLHMYCPIVIFVCFRISPWFSTLGWLHTPALLEVINMKPDCRAGGETVTTTHLFADSFWNPEDIILSSGGIDQLHSKARVVTMHDFRGHNSYRIAR